MADVEIHWPDRTNTAALLAAAEPLQAAGIETTCLVQPVRRGLPLEVLVLVASPILEPFLKAVFEKVGGDAYAAVRRFVGSLLAREPAAASRGRAPSAVVFQSTESGAQFVFTSTLPDDAYRLAVEMPPKARGRWVWDNDAGVWLQFEPSSAT